jgi:hypothetical protein
MAARHVSPPEDLGAVPAGFFDECIQSVIILKIAIDYRRVLDDAESLVWHPQGSYLNPTWPWSCLVGISRSSSEPWTGFESF